MKSLAAVARTLTVGGLMVLAMPVAAQQTYPNKPIRIIVPYPPGGANDYLARLFAPKLTESLGQQVVVDNRGGGNTIIGSDAVAKAPPDGYAILLVNPAHAIVPLLMPTPFDTIKDFAPVATLASTELILVLHPSVPANNLQELIALAKSRPGQLNYASAGTGGNLHLAVELFNMLAGIKTQHIPYKGAGPALTDLLGGQVQLLFATPPSATPYIKSGKLKAIAISGETRLPALPQVPTFTEGGLPGLDIKVWFGVLAPGGTPKGIIEKLSGDIARILSMPDIETTLTSQGMDPFTSTPEQFGATVKTEMVKWAKVIKAGNIKFEN